MVAVFCKYERDFKELGLTPCKMFRRIRNINDISGIKFTGIIKYHGWSNGEIEIIEAYEHLQVIQPELFD